MRLQSILFQLLRLSLLLISLILIFPLSHQGQSRYARQFIAVAGKKMSYESFGLSSRRPGDPVLIFEAGFGAGGVQSFKGLFPGLSKFSAGIAYDRNGEGESEEDSTLATDADLIQRLHAFLLAIHVAPPYVLIGHSMGAAYIRLFTSLYPAEVAGLVFIDGPDFMLTDQQDEEIKVKSQSGRGEKAWVVPSYDSLANDTLLSLRIRHRARRLANLFRMGYFGEYKSLTALPDVPIAVLIAYNKPGDSSAYSSGELARFREESRINIENYTDMVKRNHNSFVMLLPGYRHNIPADDPELVADVIGRIYRKYLIELRPPKP